VSSFEIVPGHPASTVVLHVPHSSRHIPPEVRAGIVLDDPSLEAELDAIVDADTDLVAEGAASAAARRPWIFVNRAARLVVDPERFPDEREELNAVGMGAVYERTTTGAVLRTPTPAQRQALLDDYFTPYADGMAQLVRDRHVVSGRLTIVDVHSYPLIPNAYELHADGPRPEICVGTDDVHTPPALRDQVVAAMRQAAPSGDVALDSPFRGCYVPLDQYGVNPDVHATMLEIRRDVVAGHLDRLVRGIGDLVDRIDS
jgi:N-formylglutamate amidohydrolase